MTRHSVPILLVLLFLCGCSTDPPELWQGYAEGDFLAIAPTISGRLQTVEVRQGQEIGRDQLLFTLESKRETAALNQRVAELEKARSTLANLSKGQRPSEIAAIEARLARAEAELHLADIQFARRKELLANRSGTREAFDQASAARSLALRQVEEVRAQLATARLGAREDEIRAGRAAVEAAKAAEAQARWALEQTSVASPAAGLVVDVLLLPGEQASAGRPVLTLLPPSSRKVRFYVPEPVLAGLTVGQLVHCSVDGLPKPLPAAIEYISPEAEYTPPVIYSSQSRAKLVFLVEARPEVDAAPLLKPGQPLDVALDPRLLEHRPIRTGSGIRALLARLAGGQ